MTTENKVSFVEIDSEYTRKSVQESPLVYNENFRLSTEKSFESVTEGHQTVAKTGLSSFVATCYVLNILMGTGFLTLPKAFEGAGIVLSPIIMLILTLLCTAAKDIYLDILARAEIQIPNKNIVIRNLK